MNKIILPIFALVLFTLSACGIKPKQVDPPPGSDNTNFPRTYPVE